MAPAAAALALALLLSVLPSSAAEANGETRAVSGGTVTFVRDGDGYYQVNTFVSDGTLSVSPSAPAHIALDFAVIGGGGAAGTEGGAGGAGGVATSIGGPWGPRPTGPNDQLTIVVGAGGDTDGDRTGQPSSFDYSGSVSGFGGGAGAAAGTPGGAGGSGGGGDGLDGASSPNAGGGVAETVQGNVGGAAGPVGDPGSGGGYTSPGTAGGGPLPISGGSGLNILDAFGPVVDGGIVA